MLVIYLEVALMASFILLLLDKLGAIEYLQVYAPKPIAKAADCAFCTSFWVSLVVAIAMTNLSPLLAVVAAMSCTPVVRKLIQP